MGAPVIEIRSVSRVCSTGSWACVQRAMTIFAEIGGRDGVPRRLAAGRVVIG
jgi:hypothetical protein